MDLVFTYGKNHKFISISALLLVIAVRSQKETIIFTKDANGKIKFINQNYVGFEVSTKFLSSSNGKKFRKNKGNVSFQKREKGQNQD